MPENVEIKARVQNPESLSTIIYDLTDSLGSILKQEDTYFKVNNGRMKLRVLENETHGQLLYYERPNTTGPKLSEYYSTFISDAGAFRVSMEKALGVLAVVKKCRRLYMYGNTRIHLDEVDNLGSFLELEVLLQSGLTTEDGEKIAKELMSQLGVEEDSLIPNSYVDLIIQQHSEQAASINSSAPVENGSVAQDISAL